MPKTAEKNVDLIMCARRVAFNNSMEIVSVSEQEEELEEDVA